MGHQEHEQIYLSLSRRELQGLCKQHGLPANRSNIDLARSLESLFRRANANMSLEEDVTPFTEPKRKDQTNSSRETDKGFGREYVTRKNSSKAGTYRRIACLKESVSLDKRETQIASQLGNDSQVNQTSDKGLDRFVNMVSTWPTTDGTTEDFGCSTSGPVTPILQRLCATDIQDIAACPQLALQYYEICNTNMSEKISQLKNNDLCLRSSIATSSAVCSLPPASCTSKKFGDCFPGSGFVSPNATPSAVPPSFQFFVASEDGVNLLVDLSSTPSDWIKSLKDEVRISQESYDRKSLSLCHEIRCLKDFTKNSKVTSTEVIETVSQLKGSDGSAGRANSSLSSVSEICNSIAHPTKEETPRSFVSGSNRLPVEQSGHLEDASQVVSSSCTASAHVKNSMVSDMLSCPGDVGILPLNAAGSSLLVEKANASPQDGSLSKSSCNLQVSLEADGLQKFDHLEHQTLEAGSFCSQNTEERCLGHMCESASEKSFLSLPNKRCEMSRSSNTCSHEHHSGCSQLWEVADHDQAKSSAYETHAQQALAFPVNNMEHDEREIENHILVQHACASPGNPVPEVPASAFDKESEKYISLKEKENLECTILLAKTCKRYHISDLCDDFQNKKQHAEGENQDGATLNLRSTKNYIKESNCDSLVLPRRSIRLMSKLGMEISAHGCRVLNM